jgi:hypothetical protein
MIKPNLHIIQAPSAAPFAGLVDELFLSLRGLGRSNLFIYHRRNKTDFFPPRIEMKARRGVSQ